MSGYAKLFSSLVTSTIWREPAHVRLVWITMLALADRHGVVEASVPGLADAARVDLAECVAALERLHAPDQWSRSKEFEGRRIETIDGGWRLLNYAKYRDRLGRQDDDLSDSPGAVRARRYRQRHAHSTRPNDEAYRDEALRSVTQRDVVDAPSASASGSAVQEEDQEQKPVGREGDPVATFIGEVGSFGQFAPIVSGFLRSQQLPEAVIATLRLHLTGEMQHDQATPQQLGLAVQQYAANNGHGRFSARYFAGFVRDVKKGIERGENRQRNTSEQRTMDREAADHARAQQEEVTSERLLRDFARDRPERYAELEQIAEGQVPKRFTVGREYTVRAMLLTLVKKEAGDAAT